MNRTLQLIENRKVGRRPTESNSFITSCDFRFNDDNFPTTVAEIGASAALVSDPPPCAINSLRALSLRQAQDTLTSLHQLAPSYRQLMPLRPVEN
jgi:hypothetical protein